MRRFTQPSSGHPVVLELFRLMAQHKRTIRSLSQEANLHENTIGQGAHSAPNRLKRRATPTLSNLDDCLHALGYRLAVVPIESAGDPAPE